MSMAERDEAALIARALAGEAAAFEELIRPYAGRLYRVVLRITRNAADAADVYQEAMLAALEKIADFRGAAAFGTWVHRIAVNCALMRQRAAAHSPVIAEEDLPQFDWTGHHAQPVQDWTESAEMPAYRAELRAALTQALDGLPAMDRTIVWLKDAEGASHEEIAAATGLSVIAARTRLHRARLSLRTRLQRYVGGET